MWSMSEHLWQPPSGQSPLASAGTALAEPPRFEQPTFDSLATSIHRPAAVPPPPRRSTRWVGVAAFSVAVALGAGYLGGTLADDGSTSAGSSSVVTTASAGFSGMELDIASAIAAVEPSVVSVNTVVETRRGPFVSSGEGAGTGVVMSADGLILTNAHVVEGATTITVTVSGETTTRTATLVASDATNDIAVLQVEDATGLIAAPIGDSTNLQVGDQVIAVGNALALEGGMTVTQGIVSAIGRDIETENGTLGNLIQTDAAISSGNSGGPLVNAAGQVVGINTAVATSSGSVSASNIGFVIPIDQAMSVARTLIG